MLLVNSRVFNNSPYTIIYVAFFINSKNRISFLFGQYAFFWEYQNITETYTNISKMILVLNFGNFNTQYSSSITFVDISSNNNIPVPGYFCWLFFLCPTVTTFHCIYVYQSITVLNISLAIFRNFISFLIK